MDEVVLNFNDEPDEVTDVNHINTLQTRAEITERLPTKPRGFGVNSKAEIAPMAYLTKTLNEEIDGYCFASIVNTSEDVMLKFPPLSWKT
jgi:hypothetical protein